MTTSRDNNLDKRQLLHSKILNKFGDRLVGFEDVVIVSTEIPITLTCPTHGEYQALPQAVLKYRGTKTPCCPDCWRKKLSPAKLKKIQEDKERLAKRLAEYERVRSARTREREVQQDRHRKVLEPTVTEHWRYLTSKIKRHLKQQWIIGPDSFRYKDDMDPITLIHPVSGKITVTVLDLKKSADPDQASVIPSVDQLSYIRHLLHGEPFPVSPDWSPSIMFRFEGLPLDAQRLKDNYMLSFDRRFR